ncbi:MAG: hypothetical protein K6G03_12705 [Lachnospiraceae bacterium]|nr:hypothetical protein [Lachnospiraceae bacterium]
MDNKILVSSRNIVINEALEKVDNDIKAQGYAPKDAIHIRLLAEEAMGMLKAMAGNYTAMIWIEKNGNEANVNISAKTDGINYETKKELIAVSTSGKNASSKGFMGKLGELIENNLLNREAMLDVEQEYGSGYITDVQDDESSDLMMAWSLSEYRKSLRESGNNGTDNEEKRDILEKSIVAKLAKDVVVGVKKDKVDMTMRMELTGK